MPFFWLKGRGGALVTLWRGLVVDCKLSHERCTDADRTRYLLPQLLQNASPFVGVFRKSISGRFVNF